MIPNHAQYLVAVTEHRKVRVQYYSQADGGVIDRICAALDYGPGAGPGDGLNRYWLWEYADAAEPRTLGLLPGQIVDLRILGEAFDPANLGIQPGPWSVPPNGGPPA